MTEKSKIPEATDQQAHPKDARYVIDPVAFFKALVAAPLVVAIFGCWAFGIPIVAAVLGGPVYLFVGTPILMIYLGFRHGQPANIALLAFAAMAVILLMGLGLWYLSQNVAPSTARSLEDLLYLGAWGLIFAPLWGLAFGKLYNRWRSAASRQPLPPLA